MDLRKFEIAQRHREASDRSWGMRWMHQERPDFREIDVFGNNENEIIQIIEIVTRSHLLFEKKLGQGCSKSSPSKQKKI